MFKAKRGRVIAELIEESENQTKSGLIVINRKEYASRARVLSVGDTQRNGKHVWEAPCKEGDIIYFKRMKPISLEHAGTDGYRKGKFTIYFDEIVGIEDNDSTGKTTQITPGNN